MRTLAWQAARRALRALGLALLRSERATRFAGDVHPEDICHMCGGPNVSWYAPAAFWRAVWDQSGLDEWAYQGIICPTCFGSLARLSGVSLCIEVAPSLQVGEAQIRRILRVIAGSTGEGA